MTYAAHHKDFVPYIEDLALSGSTTVNKKKGFMRRIIDAAYKSPQRQTAQRQTDRQVACLVERSRECHLEREMMRRLSRWDWNARN